MVTWKKLSRTEPETKEKSKILAKDLCRATLDFLDSELHGAFETSFFGESDAYITASPDWLMQYIKLLFNTVYGSSTVFIDFSIKNKYLEISTEWRSCDKAHEPNERELERAAESAGFKFDIKRDENSFTATIKAELDEFMALQVYALSYNEIYEAFKRAFFL